MNKRSTDAPIRVGQGIDVHAFCAGDHVMLGGVRIAHDFGLEAHSDGDVVLHALCDALLGALALGDIGKHFPPDHAQWEGADSSDLLERVYAMVTQRGYVLANADITVLCERPKLAGHIPAMCRAIAARLRVDDDSISVKATTTEQLGFCGRREGIAATAVVLIHKQSG